MMLTGGPLPEDIQFSEGADQSLQMVETGRRDFVPRALFIRDDESSVVAGLDAFTWTGWLQIKLLWYATVSEGKDWAPGSNLEQLHEVPAGVAGAVPVPLTAIEARRQVRHFTSCWRVRRSAASPACSTSLGRSIALS
jgi:hypothetical protein